MDPSGWGGHGQRGSLEKDAHAGTPREPLSCNSYVAGHRAGPWLDSWGSEVRHAECCLRAGLPSASGWATAVEKAQNVLIPWSILCKRVR